ncbi:prostaglandin F synthase 2-like [Liolophura sinensis]|uniref:prostaglandin F synthase 2-like n=1 Tax=Liolophura sinensis TaxID=3198878 RepID=UPI0031598138
MFITTKLARARMGGDSVAPSLQQSLDRLQMDYVDLYLVHSPFGYKNRGNGSLLPRDQTGRLEYEHYDAVKTWREMEKLVDAGKVKSIGVSNFNSVQLDYVCRNARIIPVTNQVEVHAYLPQYALNEFCRSRGITLTAYAPLGAPRRADVYQRENDPVLLEEEIVLKIAKKYGKTPAQILLRDIVQRGIAVLPKSSTPSRIKENIEIFDFELAQEDVVALAELNKRKRRFYDMLWMAEGHPDYPFTVAY